MKPKHLPRWRNIPLRAQIFLLFGSVILFSVLALMLYTSHVVSSALRSHFSMSLEQNIAHTGEKLSTQLLAKQQQSALFANDLRIRTALDDYANLTRLQQFDAYRTIDRTVDSFIQTGAAQSIRLYLPNSLVFLRDNNRYITGKPLVEPEISVTQRPGMRAYWDLTQMNTISCYQSINGLSGTVAWVEFIHPTQLIQDVLLLSSLAPQSISLFDLRGRPLMGEPWTGDALPVDAIAQASPDVVSTVEARAGEDTYLLMRVRGFPIVLAFRLPNQTIQASADATILDIALAGSMVLLLSIAAGALLSHSITHRLHQLGLAMKQVGLGELDVRVPVRARDELGQMMSVFNRLTEQVGDMIEDVREHESARREAELRLLQAQINPHFLYNVLDAITWSALSAGAAETANLTREVSDFLRLSLTKTNESVPLAREIKHLVAYFNVQRYRFGERISLSLRPDPESLQLEVMPLMLQPLLENALLHGILCEESRKGHVEVSTQVLEGVLIIIVSDDGVGIDPDALTLLRASVQSANSGSYGLWNVHQRIMTRYGEAFGLSIHSQPGKGTQCVVTMPATKFAESS